MGIVQEEADETVYWFELVQRADGINQERLGAILGEARQWLAMVIGFLKTARSGSR